MVRYYFINQEAAGVYINSANMEKCSGTSNNCVEPRKLKAGMEFTSVEVFGQRLPAPLGLRYHDVQY